MTTFRNAAVDDLDRLAAIGDAEATAAVRRYLLRSLESGETSPTQWFLAEHGGAVIGRVVYWGLPRRPERTLDVFSLTWADSARADMASGFLRHSLDALRDQGVTAVSYEHHEPDPDGHTPARLIACLLEVGFEKARVTQRYQLAPVLVSWNLVTPRNRG